MLLGATYLKLKNIKEHFGCDKAGGCQAYLKLPPFVFCFSFSSLLRRYTRSGCKLSWEGTV